ncbi:MAG TPA: cupin domain-containing protein [Tepidiformaceae bacterium]|nr:cupin domain-containing protein [Tepidiformaceae bacterium]
MNVIRRSETSEVTANNPIFTGTVSMRSMVSADASQVGANIVHFHDGARTKRHTHTADQVLYITEGQGTVGDATGDSNVEAGDIVHIPAGEVHWHGAQPGHDMAHLAIMPPCQTRITE